MNQNEYIAILFDDLGFTGPQRRDWLFQRYGKKYADELTIGQCSFVIDTLKRIKADGAEKPAAELGAESKYE